MQEAVSTETTPAPPTTPDTDESLAPAEHESAGPDRLVPVTEAIRYRKRAQAAEQQLNELKQQLEQRHQQLNTAQQTIAQLEKRQRIDALLNEADAVDLGVARLLTEQAVSEMDEPDLDLAVDDLRRHKPYLFRQSATSSPAMAPRVTTNGQDPTDQAAQRAVDSGSRRDLLDYLRLRRKH